MQIFMRFFYAFCHFCIFLTFLGVKLCIKEGENVIFCKQIVTNILINRPSTSSESALRRQARNVRDTYL